MNIIQRFVKRVDNFQQKHPAVGFPYAVVKKYGDDDAAYQGALITYYGFLSLFPLLIVVTSVLQLALQHNDVLREKVTHAVSSYLPIVGNELQSSVHSPHSAGIALAISTLITLYGAKGVADALQHTLNHVWQVPRSNRPGFPVGPLKSLGIIVIGGGGLLLAGVLSGYATSLGHSFIFKVVSVAISVIILLAVFLFIFKIGISSRKLSHKDLFISAATAAVGLQILQTIGGYVITHELKNLTTLYGTFAIVLGILFWIYLQTQVVLYAVEVDTVRVLKLWPRSITQDPLTVQDERAYRIYAEKESYRRKPQEEIEVTFEKRSKS